MGPVTVELGKHLQATLRARFPAAFPEDPRALRPLKIGIREDLLAALTREADHRLLPQLLAKHTGRIAYLRALMRASHRIDLNGQPIQPVDEHSRALAAQKLEAIEARRQARAAPRTSPPTAEQPPKPTPSTSRLADTHTPSESPRKLQKRPRPPETSVGRSGTKPVPIRIKRKRNNSS